MDQRAKCNCFPGEKAQCLKEERRPLGHIYVVVDCSLSSHFLDNFSKPQAKSLPLHHRGVCIDDSWDRAADAHKKRELVECHVGQRSDGTPVNDGEYVELTIDQDIIWVEVVVGKAKSLGVAIYCSS